MNSVDYRNREDTHGNLVELEGVKRGTEGSSRQILKTLIFKVHWFLAKIYCYAVQRIFPEFDLHNHLLRVTLAELDDIEGLSPLA